MLILNDAVDYCVRLRVDFAILIFVQFSRFALDHVTHNCLPLLYYYYPSKFHLDPRIINKIKEL